MPLKVKITYALAIFLAVIMIYMVYLTKNDEEEVLAVGVRGIVQEITIQDSDIGKGSLFVKGSMYKDTSYDQAYVSITDETQIYIAGDQETLLSVSDVSEGDYVDVYFTGEVMESYPVQAKAGIIIINTIHNVEEEPEDESGDA